MSDDNTKEILTGLATLQTKMENVEKQLEAINQINDRVSSLEHFRTRIKTAIAGSYGLLSAGAGYLFWILPK